MNETIYVKNFVIIIPTNLECETLSVIFQSFPFRLVKTVASVVVVEQRCQHTSALFVNTSPALTKIHTTVKNVEYAGN